MKILICTGSFKTGKGGVASYAHDFIDAFRAEHHFAVITHDDYKKKIDDDFPIYHISMEDWSVQNAKTFMDIINKEKPDIIINSYFPLLALITPYLPDTLRVITISHFVKEKLAWAAGLNGNYTDAIVSLSTYGKLFIKNMFRISDDKIRIVYNYMPTLENINLEGKKHTQRLKIVYPGGCSWQKSAEIVCQALILLQKTKLDFEFYWLGDVKIPGANWPLSKTKSIKDCIDMNDKRLMHIGSVPREQAKEIISTANIFLLPSRGEGCPITLLEAMRGGCIPIISDAKHGSLDLIENGHTGFVVKQDSATAIKDKIEDIITHHVEYSTIYDAVIDKFNKDLKYEVWKENMVKLLTIPSHHRRRKPFNLVQYKKDVLYLKSLYLFHWLRDRFCRQLYHVIYFRYLKYITCI